LRCDEALKQWQPNGKTGRIQALVLRDSFCFWMPIFRRPETLRLQRDQPLMTPLIPVSRFAIGTKAAGHSTFGIHLLWFRYSRNGSRDRTGGDLVEKPPPVHRLENRMGVRSRIFYLWWCRAGATGCAFTALSSTGVSPVASSVAPDGISVVEAVIPLREPV
jgi:hypothetical protein